MYLIAGAETGPTVFVIAGIHGDEPAPPLAADALLRWEIGRGLMYVVPRANPTALAAGKRRTPGSRFKDLNRNFPQQGDTAPRGLMAREIWDVVARVKPAWLLDLHEGIDFNRNNPKSVGSSVLFNRSVHDLEQPAQRLIDAVNETVDTPWRKFTLLTRTAPGSLVRAAAERLDTRALILETTSHSEPIDVRVAQHLVMVETLLSELGMAPNKP